MDGSAENGNRLADLLMAADSVIALPTALALKHAGLDYLLFDVETAR